MCTGFAQFVSCMVMKMFSEYLLLHVAIHFIAVIGRQCLETCKVTLVYNTQCMLAILRNYLLFDRQQPTEIWYRCRWVFVLVFFHVTLPPKNIFRCIPWNPVLFFSAPTLPQHIDFQRQVGCQR